MSGSLPRMPLTFGGEPALGMSVRAATTASITVSTALNAGDTLDGLTLAAGDLVLVKDQAAPSGNGIYLVGATPVRWRAFDRYNDHPGRLISVEAGTANAGTQWLCTSTRGGTLGTTALTFTRMIGTTAATFSSYLDGIFTGEANGDIIARLAGAWVNSTLTAYLDAIFTEANGDILGRTGGSWTNRTLAAVLGDMLTTRGDLLTRDASAPVRLALGASGTVFRSDGTDATWATVATMLGSLLTARGQIIRRGASAPETLAAEAANTFVGGNGTDVTTRTASEVRSSLDIAIGTYTPTYTLTTNLDAASGDLNYVRVASGVVVFGQFAADATAAAAATTVLGVSLPIASNFGATGDAGGTAVGEGSLNPIRVAGDAANDRFQFRWASASTASTNYGLIAGYRII